MSRERPDLTALAAPGARIAVRAQPGARRNAVEPGDPLRISVTAPPADGAANDAIRRLLARALGVPLTRLTLIRGAQARDKVFRFD